MISRVFQGLLAFGGGSVTSQFPEFYQQYTQRLGGHLDQARLRLAEISVDAQTMGLSVEAYIQTFLDSDPHRLEGQRMQESFVTVDRLAQAEQALKSATILEQPGVFAAHFDPTLAQAVGEAFKPALPLTMAGIIYALTGGAIALLLWQLGRLALRHRSVEKVET